MTLQEAIKATLSKTGGKRKGAGRKPTPRDAGKKLRAVWCWTTPAEQDMINTVLTADERTLILFQCVVAKQNGNDWWNNKQGDDAMADKISKFVRCTKSGEYIASVSEDDAFDLALSDRISGDEILRDVTSDGKTVYYRAKK